MASVQGGPPQISVGKHEKFTIDKEFPWQQTGILDQRAMCGVIS